MKRCLKLTWLDCRSSTSNALALETFILTRFSNCVFVISINLLSSSINLLRLFVLPSLQFGTAIHDIDQMKESCHFQNISSQCHARHQITNVVIKSFLISIVFTEKINNVVMRKLWVTDHCVCTSWTECEADHNTYKLVWFAAEAWSIYHSSLWNEKFLEASCFRKDPDTWKQSWRIRLLTPAALASIFRRELLPACPMIGQLWLSEGFIG